MDDVQPILNRSCAQSGCHDSQTQGGDLDLSDNPTTWYNAAYQALLRLGADGEPAFVEHPTGTAHNSYLLEKLLGHELGAPRQLPSNSGTGGGHPQDLGQPALLGNDLLTLIRWIDLGATYRGRPQP